MAASSDTHARTRLIATDAIAPDPHQARVHFDQDALAELAASIGEIGVMQPILVRSNPAGGYTLLAGERRWRAAGRAGLEQIPAIVRDDLDGQQITLFGLIENLQRESLGLMETAHGLARLADAHGLTHADIAARIGKSRVYVSNFLRLLQLTPGVRSLIDANQLTLGHAKALAGLPDAEQNRQAHQAVRRGLSVHQLARAIKHAAGPSTTAKDDNSVDIDGLERALTDHVGNRVRIDYNHKTSRGELRIGFHTLDEFDGLLQRLGYHSH